MKPALGLGLLAAGVLIMARGMAEAREAGAIFDKPKPPPPPPPPPVPQNGGWTDERPPGYDPYGPDPCEKPPPTTPPPVPRGWTRMKQSDVTPALQAAAVDLLRSGVPVGSFVRIESDKAALVEWHCDKARGWHRGVSLLVEVVG